MTKGIVKWFNNQMKFGFLLTPEGREIFVHFSVILGEGYKTLKKGEPVEFEIEETLRGPRAVHVKRLDPLRRAQKKLQTALRDPNLSDHPKGSPAKD